MRTPVEYCLIAALIAVTIVGILLTLGPEITSSLFIKLQAAV